MKVLFSNRNWIWILNVGDIDFKVIFAAENSINVNNHNRNSPLKLLMSTIGTS
jgi:hypothetical protein